jgi:hypothetical protein
MDQFFGLYFPHFVVGLMLTFMVVLGGLSLQDALGDRRN